GAPDAGLLPIVGLTPGPPAEGELGEAVEAALSGDVAGSRVIRTLLGLIALLALAWIGSHPRVRQWEERMGISQVVTSGLPFVVLGLIARAPGVDILNEEVLTALTPLLQFGLGWIGFHTGFQFEGAAMDEVPRGTSSVVILLTGTSFATIAVSCGALLFLMGLGPSMSTLARDSAILALAGALSAPTIERIAGSRVSARALELAKTVAVLDDVVGVVALAMLFAWLHPARGGWELPGVGWLFVTFGMAATLGLVMYAVLRGTESAAESTALLLGSVCFTAGMAGFFSLPPLVVCFLAGILLKNMPGGDKPRLSAAFARLERPIYLVFLVVVGALWRVDDWHGWALLPVFVLARVLGRWLGARTARRMPQEAQHPGLADISDPDLVTPPMGALALAFVVTARTLYESPATQAIVTAVIGGAVATEIVVQITSRRYARARRSSVPGVPRSGEIGLDRSSSATSSATGITTDPGVRRDPTPAPMRAPVVPRPADATPPTAHDEVIIPIDVEEEG
ncbi:MAG: cation:proton antiporter, partial [Myxococcota bacterium]|nr:cation:proton antiporter [Myxococcota bacterium]